MDKQANIVKIRKICEVKVMGNEWDKDFIQRIFNQKGYVCEDTKIDHTESCFNIYKYEESEVEE